MGTSHTAIWAAVLTELWYLSPLSKDYSDWDRLNEDIVGPWLVSLLQWRRVFWNV